MRSVIPSGAVSYEQYLENDLFTPLCGYLISASLKEEYLAGNYSRYITDHIQQKETWESGKEKTV